MRKKKVILKIFGLLLVVFGLCSLTNISLAEKVTPAKGDINLDIDISTKTPEILSGNNAVFELNLKVTGNDIEYNNVVIKIGLPDNAELTESLNDLSIEGVIPEYNPVDKTLVYKIDKVKSGTAGRLIYTFKTENGLNDGSKIVISSELTADEIDLQTTPTKTEASVTVVSTLEHTSEKKYVQTLDSKGEKAERGPMYSDTGIWSLSLNIPNKSIGQEYLQPGSFITIEDTLPKELGYISDNSGGVYDATTKKVSWTFEVPSIEEQKRNEMIFSKKIELKTKFIVNQTANSTGVSNRMNVELLDSNQKKITSQSEASVEQGKGSAEIPTVPPNGTKYTFSHKGPSDGIGNISNVLNPNPTVGPNSLLLFYFAQTPYYADSPDKPFKSYETRYKIDDKLEVNKLKQEEQIMYRPNASYPGNHYLSADASIIDVYATVNGVEKLIVQDIKGVKEYTRDEFMNYDNPNEHISELRYVSRYRAAGIITYQRIYFTPKLGAQGSVENRMCVNYEGYNASGGTNNYSSNFDTSIFSNLSSNSGPRNANITQNITNLPIPIVSNSIELTENNSGLVDVGENKVKGILEVDKSSSALIEGPYSSYIILPNGVKYNPKQTEENPNYSVDLVNDNYQNKGVDLVKVTWNLKDELLPGKSLSFEFGVTITSNAPSQIVPELYTYIGTKLFDTPAYSNVAITNSTIINNDLNLNGSDDRQEKVILTKNKYSLLRSDKIVAKELIKGELDTEYDEFGFTKLGGNIDYRIELTNTGSVGDNFVLLNVLPTVGDLGITDNAPLGTKFDPILTGPIKLPKDENSEFEVFYSTSKNPSRKDLIENVEWPSTTTPMKDPVDAEAPNWVTESQVTNWGDIHSFMVKSKKEFPIVTNEKIVILFNMKAPNDLPEELLDSKIPASERAAWNSFAYTINNLQPVEPAKVGVAINEDSFNFKIVKEDDSSEKKLSKAEFTLYDENKIILETGITNSSGKIIFDNLNPGIYYLQETLAPPGYELNNKMYELEITSGGEVMIKNSDGFIKDTSPANSDNPIISVTMINHPKVKIPNTGSNTLLFITILGLVTMFLCSLIYYIKKKEVNL